MSRPARGIPPRRREFPRPLLPDHFRRRAATAPSSITAPRPPPNARSTPGSFYLVDSGAQYLDGTTDVTRTVAIGDADGGNARPFHPRAQRAYRACRVPLPQGHDAARSSMRWRDVRSGRSGSITITAPATASALISACMKDRSASRRSPNSQPLLPGMIVSNEPGYYNTGAYGIRIENLVAVGRRCDRRGRRAAASTVSRR